MDHFLKSLLNLLEYYLFYVLVFGHKAHGILAPPPDTESTVPALEGGLKHWIAREVPILTFSDISRISFRVINTCSIHVYIHVYISVYQYMQQTHSW